MKWLRHLCCFFVLCGASLIVYAKDLQPAAASVLDELKAGNQRYISGQFIHPHESLSRRQELAAGQQPHAIFLTCADSRVAPEIVFDQGLGDLFDVRVAGNVAGDDEIASMEYAAEHLHTPLIVVMGHQKCGAVSAAVEGGARDGHLPALMKAIQPAVNQAKSMKGDLVENAVQINVENIVAQLRASKPILAELVEHGKLQIVGAVYSLDTGKVSWLSEGSPTQTAKH